MASLNCLFLVQGEGRGHLTQAMALRGLLAQAGHRVGQVLVGRSTKREVPGFFLDGIDAPVTFLDSPSFARDAHDRSVRLAATVGEALAHASRFHASLHTIDAALQHGRPDVVINFFEPLGGLYYLLHRPPVPMVSLAHQYLFLHPAYRFPPGRRMQRAALRLFTRLTAAGATRRLALSLYPLPDVPAASLIVVPPLLRPQAFSLPRPTESFLLVYLLNSGYADEIVRWHHRHPEQSLHCFWDRSDAALVERYDATLTFHRLNATRFLDLMVRCRGVVTTAGFESIAEAMVLGKPVLAVPVEGHFEQVCNSLDAETAGAGLAAPAFDIDRLLDFLPSYQEPGAAFRRWVASGPERFVHEIETAAGLERPVPRVALAMQAA